MQDGMVFTFTSEVQEDADGVHLWQVPVGITIVGVSLCAEAFTGSPTGFNVDIQAGGTDVITAVAANTAGTVGTWWSTHAGGTNAPVAVAAKTTLEVDVNLVAGSTPKADYTLVIYALPGTV